MANLFDKAIAAVRKLPDEEQNRIGAEILDELADEARWADKFARTPEVLDALIAEADEDIAAGRVYPLEFPKRP
jgi:hypothetical protein